MGYPRDNPMSERSNNVNDSETKEKIRFFVENEETNYTVYLETALEEYEELADFGEYKGKKLLFTQCKKEDIFDLVITIGGDGTILWAHKLLDREEMPPFVCFDGGSLCFLSNFSMEKTGETLAFLHNTIAKGEQFDTFDLSRIRSFVKSN